MTKQSNTLSWFCAVGLILALAIGCGVSYFNSRPQKRASRLAYLATEYSAGGAENCRITEISKPDSIIDNCFFTEGDSKEIMQIMDYLSEQTIVTYEMAGKSDSQDFRMGELSRMSGQANQAMQDLMQQISFHKGTDGVFTGWKLKVVYECNASNGVLCNFQRWLAIDPSGQFILQSYDLPLIPRK